MTLATMPAWYQRRVLREALRQARVQVEEQS